MCLILGSFFNVSIDYQLFVEVIRVAKRKKVKCVYVVAKYKQLKPLNSFAFK